MEIAALPYFELFLPLILVLIIAYLYFQMKKKELFIRSIMEKLDIRDKNTGKDELSTVLSKLNLIDFTKFIGKDKFLDPSILKFIFSEKDSCRLFLHYTKETEVAETILKEGFQFRYSFYKTAERIVDDKLDLIYKHNRNKPYGTNVILIAIGNKIFDYYTGQIAQLSNPEIVLEQLLTDSDTFLDENGDLVYTLSNKYIQGYFNYDSGLIFTNPGFEPEYDSDSFRENLAHKSSR